MDYIRTCICCGKTYRFCNNCVEFKTQPRWKHTFDTEECKNLYGVFESFVAKKISADEAKDSIDSMNLSNSFLNSIHPVLKKNLDDIRNQATPKKYKFNRKKEIEFPKEDAASDEIINSILVNDEL